MDLGGLDLTLAVAALVAGLTGTWSPCGFSMIETIGPVGHTGGPGTTLAACVTFILGALVGGVVTFGALALAGAVVHGADSRLAYGLAAALALAAAAAEARGAPIVPQVRRQLPEHWRRLMPMAVAAGLYGILLGLGFTTFVLTFGVFALAGIVFAVGEPVAGVAVGLAFGFGRALPVALTAPIADREAGIRITELMAERPQILRGLRLGDALSLVAAAAALMIAVPANAAKTVERGGADPGAGKATIVFERPDGTGFVRRDGDTVQLPGRNPAIGGGRVAVTSGPQIVVLSLSDLAPLASVPATNADSVAVSKRWLAWREHANGRDLMRARRLSNPDRPGRVLSLGRAGGASQLGRPSVDGNRLVYARATRRRNAIVKRTLGGKGKSTVMRSKVDGLSNPSLRGGKLLYVRHTRRADRLKIASVKGRGKGRTLLSRRRGTLWSTGLGRGRAYVTLIGGTAPSQRVLTVKR